MTITAAVDGSALGNPGPAGWAWVVSATCWEAGGWPRATNNLGELPAVQELLRATREAGLAQEPLHVLADSQYAINVVTKWRHGWKKRGWAKADKKPIANLEVIQAIDEAMVGRSVTFEWVRGHAGHAMNEMADDRAREAAEAYQSGSPAPAGPGFAGAGLAGAGTPVPPDKNTSDEGAKLSNATGTSAGPARGTTGAAEVMDAEKRFIRAWAAGEAPVLSDLAAADASRVWPDGTRTSALTGPVPQDLRVSHLSVRAAGSGAWLVTYTLTWDGGSSHEASLWEVGPRLVWHQSTPRRALSEA